MTPLPLPIVAFFLLTTLVAFALFAKAVRGSKPVLVMALFWLALQAAVAIRGFYFVTNTLPPHFVAAIAPPLVVILLLLAIPAGRRFLDTMDLNSCILIHTVRILVELNLFWLFLYKQVPRLLTFEGGNIDILAGISAPIIWWAYSKGRIGRRGLLVWNILALLSVLNAVGRALLSAPFRFQHFAFDQPTVAILSFPFVLLPAFIVPAVLLCHVALFRKLRAARV